MKYGLDISETASEVIIEGMQAAKKAGAVVSFDLKYRAKLWKISGGRDQAVEVLNRIAQNADVVVGNEEEGRESTSMAFRRMATMPFTA